MAKTLGTLAIGDVVLSLGGVVFDEPHTVTDIRLVGGRPFMVFATGGCGWPVNFLGEDRPAVVR